MSTPAESFLDIKPSHELRFKGPFKDEVSSSSLKVTNTSDKKITFKIKTTAPKRYCVRPNQGVLTAGAAANIAVMLQPFNYDPAEKNKHKFMVQTMFLPDGDNVDLEALWKNASPDQVMTSNKMRCVFELPADAPETPDLIAGRARQPEPKDVKTATDEAKHMREEISNLMSENLHLKEESVRLRRQAASGEARPPPSALMPTTAPADPMMYYVMALIALVVGVIMGKLFM